MLLLSRTSRHVLSPQLRRTFTSSAESYVKMDLFNPTSDHKQLRELVRNFVINEVDKQALEYNRKELMNVPLFKKLGDLGLLGIIIKLHLI